MLYTAKDLAEINGQTISAIHAIARQMPLLSETAMPRAFHRIDALAIIAVRILRNHGLAPAICVHVGSVLVREFKRIDQDKHYRPFLFAFPTSSRVWLTALTTNCGEALDIIDQCPTAIYTNVAVLMGEAEEGLGSFD